MLVYMMIDNAGDAAGQSTGTLFLFEDSLIVRRTAITQSQEMLRSLVGERILVEERRNDKIDDLIIKQHTNWVRGDTR